MLSQQVTTMLEHALTQSCMQDCFKLNLEDPSHAMTTYAGMHCSTLSLLTTDMALVWRQCCSHVK